MRPHVRAQTLTFIVLSLALPILFLLDADTTTCDAPPGTPFGPRRRLGGYRRRLGRYRRSLGPQSCGPQRTPMAGEGSVNDTQAPSNPAVGISLASRVLCSQLHCFLPRRLVWLFQHVFVNFVGQCNPDQLCELAKC